MSDTEIYLSCISSQKYAERERQARRGRTHRERSSDRSGFTYRTSFYGEAHLVVSFESCEEYRDRRWAQRCLNRKGVTGIKRATRVGDTKSCCPNHPCSIPHHDAAVAPK